MKIDAHQHFWIYNETDYGWIDKSMKKIRQDFLPEDLQKELEILHFDGSVVVQARQSLEETRWLLSLSNQFSFIKAVVGWIDLQSEKIEEQLIEFTGERKFAGVRHALQDEIDVDFMLKKEFIRGLAYLQDYGLTYDLLIHPEHLKAAGKLANKFPELKLVIDHLAKPGIKDKIIEPWATDFKELSKCENVYCKISGLVTEADWQQWSLRDFRPYLDIVFNSYGPDRIMIGSDWPVCLLAGTYSSVMKPVLKYLQQFSEADQRKILGENCNQFYSLNL